MTTVDHKRIGLMYLVATSIFFLIGGMAALALRLVLLTPKHTMFGFTVDAETYNRLFTLHGAIMVFLFIIPAIPGSLTNFVLPLMLGAKDVAFPKLNLASFYIYVAGCDGGGELHHHRRRWTPAGRSIRLIARRARPRRVATMTMAAFILGFSSILTGLNFIATVHKLRAPGMGWFDMPLFVWGMYSDRGHPDSGDSGAGDHAGAAGDREDAAHRYLRSEIRWRSGVVPTLLLVLFASGRVHHDSAGHGDHF